MDYTFPTQTEEGFVGSNAWLDLCFRRGFNHWSLFMLVSTNSRLPAFKILAKLYWQKAAIRFKDAAS